MHVSCENFTRILIFSETNSLFLLTKDTIKAVTRTYLQGGANCQGGLRGPRCKHEADVWPVQ